MNFSCDEKNYVARAVLVSIMVKTGRLTVPLVSRCRRLGLFRVEHGLLRGDVGGLDRHHAQGGGAFFCCADAAKSEN